MKKHTAYVSVGSNLGNRLANCQKGVENLTRAGNVWLRARSRVYETEPVGYKQQDWFINLVVKIETILDTMPLLEQIQSIQRDAGRTHDVIRFGPRVLDLDILLYDDLVLNSKRLVLPHPRMHKRRFVLRPICDIDPNIIHPVFNLKMQSLLNRLEETGQRMIEFKCLDF
ncbi:MAG: 2-amino-4-hydroxy-6-hydroxymethyldihydropteridine diphosphokinase [Desulfobacterales bacterium]|nr:MAG: 2-amino-4-hydroxy-6-hydroxymethyldihydropteridine diphosphokinase [Desulfobacterales bacterium]